MWILDAELHIVPLAIWHSRVSRVLIDQHLIFCSYTWSTCCNTPRKCTPVKYKVRQKAGFPIVTYTTSFWTLDPRRWTLDAGLWTRDSRRWTLDAGHSTLDSRRRTLDAGPSMLDPEHWTLDTGISTLEATPWTLGSVLWTLLLSVSEQDQNPVTENSLGVNL